jgi:hypothetical protein
MAGPVYEINKGINRPMEFRGIKAQYIIYLAAGLVALLLLFAILYIAGAHIYICLGIIIPAAAALIMGVKYYSNKYGQHGLKRKMAENGLPACIRSGSKKIFEGDLRESLHEEDQRTEGHPAHL